MRLCKLALLKSVLSWRFSWASRVHLPLNRCAAPDLDAEFVKECIFVLRPTLNRGQCLWK